MSVCVGWDSYDADRRPPPLILTSTSNPPFPPQKKHNHNGNNNGNDDRELKKVYHYNQCLYWAKGLAEWVGVWDVDEFLTPRAVNKHFRLYVYYIIYKQTYLCI